MAGIGLLGVPANSAGSSDGVARAPKALRDAGLVGALEGVSPTNDRGDLTLPDPSAERDPETHLIDPAGLRALVDGVRAGVVAILGDGRFPLVVGGDCPLVLGCLAAFGSSDRRGLLFVDGHEDAYPPERSTTGEAADTELALALGMADVPWWPDRVSTPPLVSARHVQLLGARDAALLVQEDVPSLGDRVSLVGAGPLARDPEGATRTAVAALPERWWFHLDLDVLSTEALPAVDYPQDGGLGWEALDVVAATALAAGPVGWDVTIYNPDLDPDRTHAARIVRFVETAARAIPAAG
ncbi:MAG: arginase family protein [Actinomycetota bacterium]